MGFEIESQRDVADKYLIEMYGFDLTYFEFSLRNIIAFYGLIDLKKKETLFRKKIKGLETGKELLIENIDNFLTKTKLWDKIKKNQLKGAILTHERKASYIKSSFIDEKIKFYKRRIAILRSFPMKTEERKKRIKPQTLIALVWYLAVQFGDNTKSQKFEDVALLMNWFFYNEGEEMMKLFSKPIEIFASAVKNDYERYIQNPNEIQKIYYDLASSIYSESFFNIEE